MNGAGKRERRSRQRMAAVLLALCLVLTLLPVEYYGVDIPSETGSDAVSQWEVLSFSELPEGMKAQVVESGTTREELNLPNTLRAVCRPAESDVPPETEASDTETTETEQPNTEAAETETPNTEAAETEAPDTEATETETPDTETPETETPDTEIPDTETAETEAPDTEIPDTETTETEAPDTETAETEAPDTEAAETEAPNTEAAAAETPGTPEEQADHTENSGGETDSAPAENSVSDEDIKVETTTVTIPENYARPEKSTRFKELSLTGQTSGMSAENAYVIEGISWSSSPEYDGETEGTYCFTPILPEGYRLAEGAALPQISVTVEEPEMYRIMLLDDDTEGIPGCGTISEDTIWGEGTLEDGELIVEPGVTLTLTGTLTIKGSVTISGGGTIVRGSEQAYLLVNSGAGLSAQGITFEGGGTASGHSMIEVNTGSVVLGDGCRILNCSKSAGDAGGAALRVNRGTAVLNNAEITNCTSGQKGGAIQAMAATVTINGGTYSNNRTTGESMYGGGFIYNDTSELTVNGGSFISNSSTGRGGCIYHGGTSGTKTLLYGGSFQGNTSSCSGSEGSGAVFNSSVSYGDTTLALSGAVSFGGADSSGTDGIYLDQQNSTPRKIYINSTLNCQVNIFLEASEGYVIAEGMGYNLQERDMKRIHFIDTGNSGKSWYAVLDTEHNQLQISETDPAYRLYVYYNSNGASGTVSDDTPYSKDDWVTVKSGDGLSLDGQFFVGWSTKPDGSDNLYAGGERIQITEDLDLYAVFSKNYTGIFYSGKAGQYQTVESGTDSNIITTPELAEMEGFTPVGWDKRADGYTGGIRANSAFVLTDDISFYGVYKKAVTVTYDANGGNITSPKKTENLYANVNETEISFQIPEFTLNATASRAGYTLNGWTASPDGTGTLYKPGSLQKFDEDMKLYANWTADDSTLYTVEHYKQSITGDGYEREDSETQHLSAPTGTEVTAVPKTYDGFSENKSHSSRVAKGTVTADGSLTLRLYYDRDVYSISFDINQGSGDIPETQTVRYGGVVQQVSAPQRVGYEFGGWYIGGTGEANKEWEFDRRVEENTSVRSVVLHAKWEDRTPPVLGEASFNEGYKNLLHRIIRKKDLVITVPITEEGSGISRVDYTLLLDEPDAALTTGSAGFELLEDGQYTTEIIIDREFKGRVTLSCTDNFNNPSPEKSVTAEEGRIIVEDNAPEITFSSGRERTYAESDDTERLHVSVEDEETVSGDSRVSGGIAEVFYQIDNGEKIAASDQNFEEEIVTSLQFDVAVSERGEHTVSVTASDHAGNENRQEITLGIREQQGSYEIGFDLNGADGTAPDKQIIRYGAFLQAVEAPQRIGYTFKGWYMDKEGTDGRQWDFSKTVEKNTSSAVVTLYAKWVDETAPKLEKASYNNGYKTLFNYAIRQPTLFITVPIIEEGSGVKSAAYTLMPETGSPREGRAKIETENGYTVAKISVKDNFKGAVSLSAVDNAGNVSVEKVITAKDGIILEDNAPRISFSAKGGELSESFSESADVDVTVSDSVDDGKISGGIARVSYQLDEGKETDVQGGFGDALVEEYGFSVHISGENTHYLSVTAVDNAGNESSRRVKIEIRSPQQAAVSDGSPVDFINMEPKTGDASHVEIYAAVALMAAFVYILLLLCAGGEASPEDELHKKLDRLSRWAKKGGKIRRMLAISAIFFLLTYYHVIEKRALAQRISA